MTTNLILQTDSYKFGHFEVLPSWVRGTSAYIAPRMDGSKAAVMFGLQRWIKKTLSKPITAEDIQEAKEFAQKHGEPFNEAGWKHILTTYNGYLPIKILGVPEGLPVRDNTVMVVVECTDRNLAWLPGHLETSIQRGVWFPSTITTGDLVFKRKLKVWYEHTGADMGLLPFALHDFGARGVSSGESAEIGGMAHLVNFMGSDTVEGVVAANKYYHSDMAGFSVRATEHSIECAYGGSSEQEAEYLETVLKKWAKPGQIVSIVIDGYDVYRAAQALCTKFNGAIISSGAKVVFRPDSGDMLKVIPKLLEMQDAAFGHTLTAKGFKKINNVGIIQGDGIDYNTALEVIELIADMGYSADNVVFGSGGGLLQKLNRDTMKFAMKVGAYSNWTGDWVPIKKAPITDMGKASLSGRLRVYQNILTKEFYNIDISSNPVLSSELIPIMVDYYGLDMETLKPWFREDTLEYIRARCN